MATTDISLNFDTNHLKLTNMVINYNNEAVATENNALLSIVPLEPPTNNSYNVMVPIITYSPKARTVGSGSTTSNILINEDDASLIQMDNIKNIDFDVGGDITTLEVGNTVNLDLATTSNSNIEVLNNDFNNTLSALISSLTSDTNVVFLYQLGNTVYIFIPNGTITSIYTSTILSNNVFTTPELINVSLPEYISSGYVAINGDYMYVVGLNSSGDIVIYYAGISGGVLSTFNLSSTTLPDIVNNTGDLNFNTYYTYSNIVSNLFIIYNNYIYILGSITSSFEYAYAPINSNGSIGTWTIGDTLFPTSTNTYLGFSQCTVYNNVIYISGVLELVSEDYNGDAGFFTESYNFYTIDINSDGSLATATSYNYPNGTYSVNSSVLINNGNLYFFNLYSVDQTYNTDGSNGVFKGNNTTYYSNIDDLDNWSSLTLDIVNSNNLYYILNNTLIWLFSTASNKITSVKLNSNYLINSVLTQPTINASSLEIINQIVNNNIIYSGNNIFVLQNSNINSYTLNSNKILTLAGSNSFINNSDSSIISGFIYDGYLYLTTNLSFSYNSGSSTYNIDSLNSTNTIYQYTINSYGNLGSLVTLNDLPASLVRYSAIVLDSVLYIIGGSLSYTSSVPGGTVNTTIYSSPVGSNGTLGSWTTTSITVPSVGLATNVINVNNEYLLAIGNNGELYSSTITSNVPGDFTSIDSSLTYDVHMSSLIYLNGILFLGCFSNSTNDLSVYYTEYDASTNTISTWQSLSTNISNTYYPTLIYNQSNNAIIFLDALNGLDEVYYINNQGFTYSLVPTTAFTAVPTNYYINNLKVMGLVGNVSTNTFTEMTLDTSTFSDGTYTLTYNSITNTVDGLNCYLNISNIYNEDSISELQFSIQGRAYTLPPVT